MYKNCSLSERVTDDSFHGNMFPAFQRIEPEICYLIQPDPVSIRNYQSL